MRQKIVYSEAFKLSVLHALETGKVSSFNEARHIYGVGGVGTIKRWAETYGKNHLIGKVIRLVTVASLLYNGEALPQARGCRLAISRLAYWAVIRD